MKIYAEYFEENNLIFRRNTILQFGDSWNLIGNIVLANPGSAKPIKDLDNDIEDNLRNFYSIYRENSEFQIENWHEFTPDQTMHRIKKIFNGGYLNNIIKLNGVIQLFNIFNIINQDLEEAVQQINIKSEFLYSIGIEKYFHDKPTYFGFSNSVLSNDKLRKIAQDIFDKSSNIIKKDIYSLDFNDNKFYHPTYVNRAINQSHFQWYKNDILKKLNECIRETESLHI